MFNFKHFTSLQWFGLGLIFNCILVMLSYFIADQPAPWFITAISVLLALFSVLFIEWPSKNGFKSDVKKEP